MYTQNIKATTSAINILDVIWWIAVVIAIIEFICIIVLAVNVSKITKVQTQPFQNKKPDYPDKVIELLQAVVSGEQHNNEELKKLKGEIEMLRNGGVKDGMKSKEMIRHEELVKLINQQNDLLQKIVDATSGEEKRKLMEKCKQASDILNAE